VFASPISSRVSVLVRVGCAAALLTLGACSNTQSPINRTPQSGTATATDVNGVQHITLLVGDDYRFHPSTFYVRTGKVDLTLKHTGTGAPHDFEVNGFPGDYVGQVHAGQSVSGTFSAPSPGRYQFVCTIHTRQGMVGTMIVTRG
jgi:plastocyanin